MAVARSTIQLFTVILYWCLRSGALNNIIQLLTIESLNMM